MPDGASALTTDPADAEALIGASTRVVRDDFAGPGGWSTGIADLLADEGLTEVALEWDASACQTRIANGHTRTLRADVAAYPIEPFLGRTLIYIASPPCQTFSMAGLGDGRQHTAHLAQAAYDILTSRITYEEALAELAPTGALNDSHGQPDPRTGLVLIPARVIRQLLDYDGRGLTDLEAVALEQVPTVGPIYEAYALGLRALGWCAITSKLNAADYGVPQTRERVFMLASRARTVTIPEPSHARGGEAESLFGPGRLPWVSMARAFDLPVLSPHQAYVKMGSRPHAARRNLTSDPASTIRGNPDSLRIIRAGQPDEGFASWVEGVEVTESNGAIAQGFPPDYQWLGSDHWGQIGNAVCPPVARRVVAMLLGREHVDPLPWHAYAFDEIEKEGRLA